MTIAVVFFAAPILPGKSEAWRRFMQELQGSRRGDYEAGQRLLGIVKERVYLQQTPRREVVIVYVETDDPGQILSRLAAAELPFDRWFRQQVQDLHGLHLMQLPPAAFGELVLEWSAP